MNTSEFKAWFEGFTEGMEGTPNKKQWARIQQRVKEITPHATPYQVWYNTYAYPHFGTPHWTYTSTSYQSAQTLAGSGKPVTSNSYGSIINNSADAFAAVGRADAAALN